MPNVLTNKVLGDLPANDGAAFIGSGVTGNRNAANARGEQCLSVTFPAGVTGGQDSFCVRFGVPVGQKPMAVYGWTVTANVDALIWAGLHNNYVAAAGNQAKRAMLRAGQEIFVPHIYMRGDWSPVSANPWYFIAPFVAALDANGNQVPLTLLIQKHQLSPFSTDEPITRGALDAICAGGWNPN